MDMRIPSVCLSTGTPDLPVLIGARLDAMFALNGGDGGGRHTREKIRRQ